MSRHVELHAPEGVYRCTDWVNILQNKSAAQYGVDPTAAHLSSNTTAAQSRLSRMDEVPRISSTVVRPRAAYQAGQNFASYASSRSVAYPLVSQGLDAEGFDVLASLDINSPARTVRPKLNLRSIGGSFILRSNQHQDLSKFFGSRNEASVFTVRTPH